MNASLVNISYGISLLVVGFLVSLYISLVSNYLLLVVKPFGNNPLRPTFSFLTTFRNQFSYISWSLEYLEYNKGYTRTKGVMNPNNSAREIKVQ